jgi:hypothetical protein
MVIMAPEDYYYDFDDEDGLLPEDLGMCPYCGATDDEGCDRDVPHDEDQCDAWW